jgi:hypothetical protein
MRAIICDDDMDKLARTVRIQGISVHNLRGVSTAWVGIIRRSGLARWFLWATNLFKVAYAPVVYLPFVQQLCGDSHQTYVPVSDVQ